MAERVWLVVPSAGDVPAEDENGGAAADIDADDVRPVVLRAGLQRVGAIFDGFDVKIGFEERMVVGESVRGPFGNKIADFAEGGFRERAASTSADEVLITVEDDTKEEQPEEEAPRSRFSWIRRK